MDVKAKCPTCDGTLIDSQMLQGGAEDGELVLTEAPCWCTETDTPGYVVIGEFDISDLANTIGDILNQVDAIKQKVDEIKTVVGEL